MDINDTTVAAEQLPQGKRDAILFDDTLRGFAVRIRLDHRGKIQKRFIVQYRIDGRQRRQVIRTNSAKQARKIAEKMLANVMLGNDPAAAKEAERVASSMTFVRAVGEYLELKKLELRSSSLRHSTLYLTGKYFDPLHKVPLRKIERGHVSSCINKITASGAPAAAGRARAHLSAFFTWAMKNGHCDQNPVINSVNPKEGQARDRVLKDHELTAVWKACKDDDFGRIVKLLMLTGCRRDEIGKLKWSEIDLVGGTITLPATRYQERPRAYIAADVAGDGGHQVNPAARRA
jgi:hypothetical protein